MQGDSLVSQYAGIELFNDEFLNTTDSDNEEKNKIQSKLRNMEKEASTLLKSGDFNSITKLAIEKEVRSLNEKLKFLKNKNSNKIKTEGLFDAPEPKEIAQKKTVLLQSKIAEYISVDSKTLKENLKKEIDNLKWDLIEATLEERDELFKLESIKKLRKDRIKPFFIWKLEFSEVFKNKNGFDIVIGNPPYLRVQGIDNEKSKIYKELYKSATGKYDMYVLFVEKGLDILSNNGILNYIIPHKWLNSAFGSGLRSISNNNISKLISFGSYKVFNASTYTSLVWFDKLPQDNLKYAGIENDLSTNRELESYLKNLNEFNFTEIENQTLGKKPWILTNKKIKDILDKLNQNQVTVENIFKHVSQGLVSTRDDIFFLKGKIINGFFVGFSSALDQEITIEKEIVKPLLKGGTVKRFSQLDNENMYSIYPHFIDKNERTSTYIESDLRNKFPLAHSYLLNFKEKLIEKKVKYKTNPELWYSLHCARKISMFEQEKIITAQISIGSNMTIDNDKYFTNSQNYILVKNSNIIESYKYFLGVLNSRLFWFYLKNTGTVLTNGFFRFKTNYLNTFPLPTIKTNEDSRTMELLVEQIMDKKKDNIDTQDLENEIDQLVYQLYDLNEEEIKIIENSTQ